MRAHHMHTIYHQSQINTPLGPMFAIASDDALFILEFADCKKLEREANRLKQQTKSTIIPGKTSPIQSIEHELNDWFAGALQIFNTPIHLNGTLFQKNAWHALCDIPYGETRSYLQQAATIDRPSACRAVANANSANQLAIIVPCHRIINHNGALGGYAGGLSRKKWLLDHEARFKNMKSI